MGKVCVCLTAGFLLVAAMLTPGRAQIVIPDINKDTIAQVPAPGGDRAKTPSTGSGSTSGSPRRPALDPRCAQLPEALRRTTPGCHWCLGAGSISS